MKSLSQSIGSVMREKRKRFGLSQEVLAEQAGIDRSYVSILERGLKSPTIDMLERIASVLKCLSEDIVREARHGKNR